MAVDREFVEKLDAFTEALGDVVKILKSDIDKNNTDTIDKAMDSMPDKIIQISEDLTSIKKDMKSLISSTGDIKKSIDEIKKSKETGVFGKISNSDNKKKIVDGISVIGMIAGGVLAMGLAFKLIGKVDFLSVIALSAGMVAMSYSFVMITKSMKDNKLKSGDIMMTSAILPIMALGLLGSGMIMSKMPTIGLMEGISILVVSIAMGASLFFMTKALKESKMKGKHTSQFLLLPIILPAIALGLLGSGMILSKMPVIGLMQSVSILVVSIAMGASLFFMSKALKESKMEGKHTSQFLLLPIILPAIALGIVASSWVLQLVNGNIDLLDVLKASLAVGISVLVMMPTILLINKFKVSTKDIIKGGFSILTLSGIVALSSMVLSKGDYSGNVPDYQWSLKVGLSMVVFGGSAVLLGLLSKNALIQGMIAMALLVPTIWLADWIISKGDYSKYPSTDWSLGVGLSMLIFGAATAALGFIAISGLGAGALALGLIAVIGIAALMVEVDKLLSPRGWNKFPKLDWSKGVGQALLVFGTATVVLGAFALATFGFGVSAGLSAVNDIAQTMVDVDKKLSEGNWGSFPPMKWSESVGLSLMSFTKAIANNSPGLLDKFGDWLFGTSQGENPLLSVAKSMKSVAEELNWEGWANAKYPDVKWAAGVGASLIAFSAMEVGAGVGKAISGLLSKIGGGSGSPLEDLAGSMVAIAKKMNDPIWDKVNKSGGYPSEEWATGVSMALGAFSNIMNTLDDIGVDNDEFGEEAILIISGLKRVAIYMNQDWGKPNDDINKWAEGLYLVVENLVKTLNYIDDATYEADDRIGLVSMFNSMSLVNEKLNVSWNDLPSDWSKNLFPIVQNLVKSLDYIDAATYDADDRIGLVSMFESVRLVNEELKISKWNSLPIAWSKDIFPIVKNLVKSLDFIDMATYDTFDRTSLVNLFSTINDINETLGENNKWNTIDGDWLSSMKLVVDTILSISPELLSNTNDIVKSFEKLSEISDASDNFKVLADSIKYVAEALKDVNTDVLDNLSKFSGSMLVLSLVDESKLNEFIDVIDDRKDVLKDIISLGQMGEGGYENIKSTTTQIITKTDKEEQKQREEKFNELITEIKSLKQVLLSIDGNTDLSKTINSPNRLKTFVPDSLQ